MVDNNIHFCKEEKEISVLGNTGLWSGQPPSAKLNIEKIDSNVCTHPDKIDIDEILFDSQCGRSGVTGAPPSRTFDMGLSMRITDEKGNELLCTSKDGMLSVGTRPRTPSHILIDRDEFTDEDIREWAIGNLENIDWATGQASLLIEHLSQIIVDQILNK